MCENTEIYTHRFPLVQVFSQKSRIGKLARCLQGPGKQKGKSYPGGTRILVGL